MHVLARLIKTTELDVNKSLFSFQFTRGNYSEYISESKLGGFSNLLRCQMILEVGQYSYMKMSYSNIHNLKDILILSKVNNTLLKISKGTLYFLPFIPI